MNDMESIPYDNIENNNGKKRFDSIESINAFIENVTSTPEWKALQDKTQVFNDRKNNNVKSRGSHSKDVAEIAQSLTKKLGGDQVAQRKSYLIGVLHDIGHIPYGHAGESVADTILKNHQFSSDEMRIIDQIRRKLYGDDYENRLKEKRKKKYGDKATEAEICFEHNENSVLQYIMLCHRFGYEVDEEIAIGIVAHSTSRYPNLPPTLSQQAVRLADKLAYINYDVQDLLITFPEGTKERDALIELYSEPILDPNGNEVKIKLDDGKEYSPYEFLTQLSPTQRIEVFVEAAVNDAQKQGKHKPEAFKDYETVLTGCNDLICEASSIRKKIKEAKTEEEKKELSDQLSLLKKQLYERSPVLYAAYEIKDRSDNFIQQGKGLEQETKEQRLEQAQSSVGNNDFLNTYIYKALVEFLEKEVKTCKNMSAEAVKERHRLHNIPQELSDFYFNYLQFKENQNMSVSTITGDENLVYPELYTILNFIGIHSNGELNDLAKKAGIIEKFESEVLPQFQALLENEEYYDSEKHSLTKEGKKKRDELIQTYGSIITIRFGLEEEDKYALASDESIIGLINAGYSVEDFEPLDNLNNNMEYEMEKAKADKALIDRYSYLQKITQSIILPEDIQNKHVSGENTR